MHQIYKDKSAEIKLQHTFTYFIYVNIQTPLTSHKHTYIMVSCANYSTILIADCLHGTAQMVAVEVVEHVLTRGSIGKY